MPSGYLYSQPPAACDKCVGLTLVCKRLSMCVQANAAVIRCRRRFLRNSKGRDMLMEIEVKITTPANAHWRVMAVRHVSRYR